ncbi:hypothetical protein V2J09_019902 [Rumex salicifolius]
MDSDSDSDGSHISATPPSSPSTLPITGMQPFKPPPPPPLKVGTKLKARDLPSKESHTPPPNPSDSLKQEELVNPATDASADTSYSLPIRCHTALYLPVVVEPESVITLAAGSRSFSKLRSFSKIAKRGSINTDSIGNDSGCEVGGRKCASCEVKFEDLGSSELKSSVTGGNSEKRVKKPSNLIGTAGSSLFTPLKRSKPSTEGNFVKLNINGRRRWSKNKGKNRSYNAYKSKWRGVKYSKPVGHGAGDEHLLGSSGLQEMREGKVSECNELIEEAVKEVRNMASDDNLLKLLKLTHGYDSFRDGQLEAIKMVLDLKSTMLVLPTGAGKSLCYQLPSIVFPGITLVVSPLVALMIDQLNHLPRMIPGAVLCSSQSPTEVSETLDLLQEGAIKVLFVSPERFLNEDFMSVISSTALVSLVVIDEAHCISEWSHNFRPSYMRMRKSILSNKLKVGCILAMTATPTTKTLQFIMSCLDIPLSNLIKTAHVRTNLQLSVSMSGNKMKELIHLIKLSPFSEVESIIIYCKFQHESDTISKYLCDNNIPAKSYHSGIQAKDRSRIQALFCSNKIRVVVATVAFGMGLDKSDVGAKCTSFLAPHCVDMDEEFKWKVDHFEYVLCCTDVGSLSMGFSQVIHYSLPGSIEEYVQEIGRAGRDGRLSYCHLFYDDITYYKLRSFAFSDGVDQYAVNKFLAQIFIVGQEAIGLLQSLIIESTSRKLDIKEEVMLTILTQLELDEVQYLSLLPQINVTCSLNFHKTPPLELARKELLIAAILKRYETKQGTIVFDIPTVANIAGLSTKNVLNELLDLKFAGEITYEVKDLAYCYIMRKIPEDVCTLAAQITKWLSEIEHCKVKKLDAMSNAVIHAVKRCENIDGCDSKQHTACLQRKILDYFVENEHCVKNETTQSSRFLRADIKSNSQVKFTPRAVARIMHGIGSPAYPSATWSKAHFWSVKKEKEVKEETCQVAIE